MGPRAKRRLAFVAAATAVLALVVTGVMMFGRSSHQSRRGSSAVGNTPASRRYVANRLKLIYGMTRQQVRQFVGPPETVVGNCWRYPRFTETGFNGKPFTTAEGLCFYYGRYSTQQFWMNGKWEVLTSKGAAPVS